MKYNQNADTLLFLPLFAMDQREKNIEKTLFVGAGAQIGEKQRVLGVLYRIIYRILKENFQWSLYLHKVYLPYFQLTRKLNRFQ